MSMRYIRKIQNHSNKADDSVIKVTESLKTSVLTTQNEDEDNELTINTANEEEFNKKSFNVFDFFSDLNTDDNDDSIDVDNDTDQSETSEHEVDECSSSPSAINRNNSAINKQRKKKKNRKNRSTLTEEQNDIDIDAECLQFIESCSLPCSSNDSQNFTACLYEKPSLNEILKIQPKYLNINNELRKIFGGKNDGLSVDQRKDRTSFNNSRSLRKVYLTESCRWLPSSSPAAMKNFGLSMYIDNNANNESTDKIYSRTKNNQRFVFVHDNAYQNIQKKFFAAVNSKNPQNIINVVAAYPYHVDSIIQFSEICKSSQDLQMAAEFMERALRCLELAFHPSFNVITGNCRLSYKIQTNRALFIALFRHLIFIADRACYRTSLEFCKVLLSFDPDNDPLACVLAIDWLSLRAKEYQWFINFCQTLNEERNLTQLPNIAYSLALAHFQLKKNSEVADNLLQDALFMFPNVLLGLIDKCGIRPDEKVLNHSYFFNDNIETGRALKKLEDLYVARSYHLWKNTNVLAWLENNVHTVIDKIDSDEVREHVKHCEVKRKKRYQGPLPRNISRHIILSDIKEIILSSPDIQNEDHIFSYDPLPPADSIDTYDKNTRLGIPDKVETRSSSSLNPLSLFISSLFPTADENGRIGGINNHADNERDEFD